MSWAAFLTFLKDHQIGDLTGIIGLAVTMVGFWFTIRTAMKSREAAELAVAAADRARDSIRALDAFTDLSEAIGLLEQIKRDHRAAAQWSNLPDRYARARAVLIGLQEVRQDFTDAQAEAIQGAILNLRDMEKTFERAAAKSVDGLIQIEPHKWNSTVSANVDELLRVLMQLKASEARSRK